MGENMSVNQLKEELKVLHEQLEKSNKFMKKLTSFNNQFLGEVYRWEYDVKTKTVSGADMLFNLVGLPVMDKIQLDKLLLLLKSNNYDDLLSLYVNFPEEDNGKIFENTFLLPNGQKKTFRHSAWLFLENGKRRKIYGLVKDITPQHNDNKESLLLNYLPEVFSNIDETYLIISLHDYKPVYLSRNFYKVTQISPNINNFSYKKYADLIIEEDYEKYHKLIDSLDNGLEVSEILRIKGKDELKWLKIHAIPIPDRGVVAVIVKNISKEKITEKLLDESETKYKKLINQLPFVLVIHKNGIIKFINERGKDLTGSKRFRNIIGRSIFEFIPPELHERNKERMLRFDRGEAVDFPVEELLLDKDGNRIPVKIIAEKVFFNGEWCHQLLIQDISKEKKYEKTIEQEQIKFHRLLDVAPVIITILNKKGEVILINKKGAETIGLPPDKITGKNWFDHFVPERESQKLKAFYEKIIGGTENSVGVYENSMLRANGTKTLIEWHTTLLKDDRGEITGMLSSGQDISLKKDYERSIKQQRGLLRLIVDKLPTLLAYVSKDQKFLFVNKAYADFYGYEPGYFIGKRVDDILPGEFKESNKEYFSQLGNKYVEFESNRTSASGKKIITHVRIIPHIDEDGNVIAYLSASEDITEKRKMERELIEREQNLLLLINNTPDIVCFKDAKGRWLLANDADLKLFALDNVDYVGKTDLELAEYTLPVYKESFKKCIDSDEVAWKAKRVIQNEEVIPTVNGGNKIFDILKVPVFNEDGSRKGLIVVGRDVTEKRQAEKALKESEDKFRRIFTESLTPQLLISSNAKFIDCNDAAFKLLGYNDKSSIVGKTAAELSPEFQADGTPSASTSFRYIKNAIKKGSNSFEWIHLTKNNRKVYLNITLTPLIINNKEILHVVWHDISDKIKRYQENIKLFTAIEQSPLSIVITDTAAKIEYVNPGFTHITGYAPKEVIGKNPRILKSGKTPFHTYIEMWKRLTSGEVWSGEFLNRRKNGEVYTEYCVIAPIKDDKGKVTNYVALKEDITKKKEADERLLESENRFRSLFYENESIIILFDPSNGNILEANDAACRFYGYTQSEMIKKSVFDFNVRPRKELLELIEKVRLKKQNHFYFRHKLKDGSIKDVELYTGVLNSRKKEVFYSVIHDISDKIKAEKELVKAKEKAEESDRLKSAFLANMSHEIRTPMNAILGFAALLKDEELSKEEKSQFVDIINSSGYSLLEIINDIIEMSKIEAGQITINKKETEVNQMVSSIYKQHSLLASKKNIELRYVPDSLKQNITLLLDETKVKQILTNLVNNAIKFTDEGYVEMGYKVLDTEIEFYVKDTGIGISKENHKLVFDRFNKITWDTDSKKIYPGTGLGLSISKAFVDKMGGRIFLESEKGVGTTFFFTLPLEITESSVQPVVKKELSAKLNLDGKVILVAEDTERNYQFFEIVLSKLGAEVLHAWTGKEAVDITRENDGRIDLIFMDIKMPDMNGYEATKIIKKEYPDLPIIAQTAYAFTEDRIRAKEAGCDNYISKPIIKDKLLEMLKNYF